MKIETFQINTCHGEPISYSSTVRPEPSLERHIDQMVDDLWKALPQEEGSAFAQVLPMTSNVFSSLSCSLEQRLSQPITSDEMRDEITQGLSFLQSVKKGLGGIGSNLDTLAAQLEQSLAQEDSDLTPLNDTKEKLIDFLASLSKPAYEGIREQLISAEKPAKFSHIMSLVEAERNSTLEVLAGGGFGEFLPGMIDAFLDDGEIERAALLFERIPSQNKDFVWRKLFEGYPKYCFVPWHIRNQFIERLSTNGWNKPLGDRDEIGGSWAENLVSRDSEQRDFFRYKKVKTYVLQGNLPEALETAKKIKDPFMKTDVFIQLVLAHVAKGELIEAVQIALKPTLANLDDTQKVLLQKLIDSKKEDCATKLVENKFPECRPAYLRQLLERGLHREEITKELEEMRNGVSTLLRKASY